RSSVLTRYEYREGKPTVLWEPKVFFVDDFTGKAIGINLFIGKRLRRLRKFARRSTHARNGPKGAVVQGSCWFCTMARNARTHTVPLTVCRRPKVGTFHRHAYGRSKQRGWLVNNMKNDWKRMFGFSE